MKTTWEDMLQRRFHYVTDPPKKATCPYCGGAFTSRYWKKEFEFFFNREPLLCRVRPELCDIRDRLRAAWNKAKGAL